MTVTKSEIQLELLKRAIKSLETERKKVLSLPTSELEKLLTITEDKV